jgi:hypothetical protein
MPLEDGWLDYRQSASLPKKDTDTVRAARLAFYAGSSHMLALLAESPMDDHLVDLLLSELGAFANECTEDLEP